MLLMEYAHVADPWALTWCNWYSLMTRIVPKMIRLRQGRKLTHAELAVEEAEMKSREVKDGEDEAGPQ